MGFYKYRKRKVRGRTVPVICNARDASDALTSGDWAGRRCFILGGGPSLIGFDYSQLNNDLTIGVNKSFIYHPVTINYAMDSTFYTLVTVWSATQSDPEQLHKKWLEYSGIKVWLTPRERVSFSRDVYLIKSIRNAVVSFDIAEGIHGGNNSAFGAMMLAVALGANPIYLLGCDFCVEQNEGKKKENLRTHCHDGYINTNITRYSKKLVRFRLVFEKFYDILCNHHGIEIVNLNPDSMLGLYPKKKLEEVI
jgi:hypothetical protein